MLTVTGSSGGLSHSAFVTLTVNDFSLSASSTSQSVAAGANASYTVSTAALNGFDGSVGLDVAGGGTARELVMPRDRDLFQ